MALNHKAIGKYLLCVKPNFCMYQMAFMGKTVNSVMLKTTAKKEVFSKVLKIIIGLYQNCYCTRNTQNVMQPNIKSLFSMKHHDNHIVKSVARV